MRRSDRGALLLAAAVLLGRATVADTIWLDNGDRITGRVLARDEAIVRIETAFGLLRIPRGRVVRIVGVAATQAPRRLPSGADARITVQLDISGQAFWQAREGLQLRPQDNSLRFELRLDGVLLAAYEDHTLDPGEIGRAAVNVFSFKAREARAIRGEGVALMPAVSRPSQVTLQLTLPPSSAGQHRVTVCYLGSLNAYGTRDVLSFAALALTLREGGTHRLRLAQERGAMEFAGWPRRRMRGTDTFSLSLHESAPALAD